MAVRQTGTHINMANRVPRGMRMPQIAHMKEIFRGGLQVANTALSIPVGAKVTIKNKRKG